MTIRSDRTRQKLFDSAIELMARQGYEHTSVDEIAENAGVSKGTVYYHFFGKAELVEALVSERTGPLCEAFGAIARECRSDPNVCIDRLVRTLLEHMSAEPEYSQLVITELWRSERPWYGMLRDMRTSLVETFCDTVKHGIDAGVFREDIDPDFAGYSLFGMISFVALDRLTHDPPRPEGELAEQLVKLVRVGLGGG